FAFRSGLRVRGRPRNHGPCGLRKSPLARCAPAVARLGILVYCADYRCSHSIEMLADRWGDDVRLSDIEPQFDCKVCDKRGADVRPHFEPARMGTLVPTFHKA